jgi:hypothetical protein
MANGTLPASPLAFYGNASSDLPGSFAHAGVVGFALIAALLSAPKTTSASPSPVTVSHTGVHGDGHGKQWFDRIHVLPRSKDLGHLTSDVQVSVEVWNAYHVPHVLTAVNVTGPSGVTVESVSVPTSFGGLESRIFLVDVSASGAVPVNNMVTWVFTGASSSGSVLALTGLRVVLFPVKPNGDRGVDELYGYLTDIITGWDDTEQRVQLRAVPARQLRFTATMFDPRQAADVYARLYGVGMGIFSVPIWPDATPLTAVVNAGDTVINIDTTSRAFAVGGLVLLWSDQWTWESVVITGVSASYLTTAATTYTWQVAGTLAIPLMSGRLLSAADLKTQAPVFAEVEVAFDSELA